jgi:hypothetical protein
MQLSDRELESMFDDFLDETCGEVEIAGLTYSTSRALKEVDPIAYRCGFNDWLDAAITDGVIFEQDGEYYDSDPNEDEETA